MWKRSPSMASTAMEFQSFQGSNANPQTLLDHFFLTARSAISSERDRVVLQLGQEKWTYGEVDAISNGLASELNEKYGHGKAGLKVAIISENHPYVFALILATWKLGGVVAILDWNVPVEIMKKKLEHVDPDVVVYPEGLGTVAKLVEDNELSYMTFSSSASTVSALKVLYSTISYNLPPSVVPATAEGLALLLHTSSASSPSSVKTVPLTHASLLSGSLARIKFWKRTWPEVAGGFEHLRVLGWSPWSHIIGLSCDIGAATILTGGTYVFGIRPSSYAASPEDTSVPDGGHFDIATQLLHTALESKPRLDIFAGVPWVMEGYMRACDFGSTAGLQFVEVLRSFKVLSSGGAKMNDECVKWTKEVGLRVVFDIGMTELGGPLFHATNASTQEGWSVDDCLIDDASLVLLNKEGNEDTSEGELVITSALITSGYIGHDNTSFSPKNAEGKVSFKTGDVYAYVQDVDDAGDTKQRLVWMGRKEDYVQMSSGESLDPRIVEATLDSSPFITKSAIVGNNFLKGSSAVVCAIIQPSASAPSNEIMKVIAQANRALAPPLRISWSRVLVLGEDEAIPMTKKNAVWRKTLEEVFGDRMRALISGDVPRKSDEEIKKTTKTKDEVVGIVESVVTDTLRITKDVLEANEGATFAELGMDSSMSTNIVNLLNRQLGLSLPLNTCHTHVDLDSLTAAVLDLLGIAADGDKHNDIGYQAHAPHSGQKGKTLKEADEIVIVGQAMRLPGDINDAPSLWEAFMEQRDDLMTPFPPSRWDHASFYRHPSSTAPPAPGDILSDKAGWIDIASFDHAFFGLSSSEAFLVAPSIRLSLEVAFEALENANIPAGKVKGSMMGVFVANQMDEGYLTLLYADKGWGAYTRFYATGVAASTGCGRLSYLLDIHGPSITIDTACSSGLMALDAAVQYIRSGEGESAIVCGANTHCWPGIFGFLSAQKMTSPNGRCATYTTDADGYVPAEGAAALVLKTKSAALRDGDRILAVVRATDSKHDGRSQGLVAPNVKAQIMMQRALLEKAGLQAKDIDFIESHGTGTSLGDLIEIQGINEVFKGSHTSEKPLVIGASKTCVGHTELIAGLIGVLKTLGSFKGQAVPGLVQLTENNMNPSLECGVVPILIPHENVELKKDGSLKALVLSNGFAGSIAGVVLEAPTDDLQPKVSDCIPSSTAMIFVVSAKSFDALTAYLEKYLDFCLDAPSSLFHSICYTSCVGREHYRYRFACVAHNMQDLIARIEERLQNPPASPVTNAKKILFGFPGQGCQYQGMGRYLATQYSGFVKILSEAADRASVLTSYPILPYLIDEAPPKGLPIDNSEVAQVCIFTMQYAMASWLETIGIHASSIMGHSLGEIAGCVNAGAFSFEVGLQFVVTRARSLRSDPAHPGGMVAIAATEERVAHYITELRLQDRLSIAVYNAPDNNVVSGEMKSIDKLIASVKRDGIRATKLAVAQGFHSSSIAPGLPPLRHWLDDNALMMKALEKPIFSTVRAEEIPKLRKLDTQYWVDHAQNAVKFLQTARLATGASSVDVIVDVGPQPTVWSNMQALEFSKKARIAVTGKRGKDQIVALLGGLSALFERGFNINFVHLHEQMPYRFGMTDIPTYPFQRIFNYPTFRVSRNGPLGNGQSNVESRSPMLSFVVDSPLCEFLQLHLIEGRPVLPGAAMVDIFARGVESHWIKSFRFLAPLILQTTETQVEAKVDTNGECHLTLKGDSATKICSGMIGHAPKAYIPIEITPGISPSFTMPKTEIYQCFKNVQFGEPFRTVQCVEFWDTHADGHVVVEPTPHESHDRIRKIDACLHMFAAITDRLAPPMPDADGAYLPTSLENFRLHSNDLPSTFLCRYHLPLDVGRGARTLSASFEVFSSTGDLLISCEKYSVAWVPRGVVHKELTASTAESEAWYRKAWIEKASDAPKAVANTYEAALYIGNTSSPILSIIETMVHHTIAFKFADVEQAFYDQQNGVLAGLRGKSALVVLDLTKATEVPGTVGWESLCGHLFSTVKALSLTDMRLGHVMAITSWSSAVDLYMDGLDLFSNTRPLSDGLIGSIFHGLVRVLHKDTGSNMSTSILDLPSVDSLSETQRRELVSAEIKAHNIESHSHSVVAYRFEGQKPSLRRLVPTLQRISHVPSRPSLGATIIVGVHKTTVQISLSLLHDGSESVVIFGDAVELDTEAQMILSQLPENLRGRCTYKNVDIGNYDSIRKAVTDVDSSTNLKRVILGAAPLLEVDLKSIAPQAFNEAVWSRVSAAWNLHRVTQELKVNLDSFVLFTGLSGEFGPRNIILSSCNAYFEALAAYRHNSGLPATCLHLGSWVEGRAATQFEKSLEPVDGYQLAVKAMATPIPSQVLARLDIETIKASSDSVHSDFFASLSASDELVTAKKGKLSREAVDQLLLTILRVALELRASEKLDVNVPLTSCGGDSITFAQFKGQVLKELEVDIPVIYLSEDYTIHDMITNILDTYAAL